MEPKFHDGDLIFVDPEVPPAGGRYVVASLKGDREATFTQLIVEGGRRYLKALNPDWPNRCDSLGFPDRFHNPLGAVGPLEIVGEIVKRLEDAGVIEGGTSTERRACQPHDIPLLFASIDPHAPEVGIDPLVEEITANLEVPPIGLETTNCNVTSRKATNPCVRATSFEASPLWLNALSNDADSRVGASTMDSRPYCVF